MSLLKAKLFMRFALGRRIASASSTNGSDKIEAVRNSQNLGTSNETAADPSKYNAPQYYQHNAFTYYDVDSAVFEYRIAQPNKFEPLQPKK